MQRVWTWFLKNVALPTGDYLLGQEMIKRLRFLEEAQWWEPERLRVQRDQSLNALVETAYREVPFYRDLMKDSGVTPSSVRRAEDLSKLPVVTKAMLRAGYPHNTTRNTGQKTYESSSSGSTGTNFYVREDHETAGWYRASFMLALTWAGWEIGEPHMQTGMTLNRDFARRLKDSLLRCRYVSAYELSDLYLDKTLEVLDGSGIQHLWGYPGSLYSLAQRALAKGWNRPLKSAVTWGDNLYPRYREVIERAFKTRVFDTYGCGEGIQVAAQCGSSHGYHRHSLDVIVEFLDGEGEPVAPGELGHLILTRLHPGPMPLIRYQIGDMGIAGEQRICECGRGFELMDSIQGRDTDIIITPEGNRLIVHFFTGIMEFFPEIASFQVVQEEVNSMSVRIVPRPDFSTDTAAAIKSKLIEMGATGINIQIETVKEIPTAPSGKRRFVISKITTPFSCEGTALPECFESTAIKN
jgi:phenylacetate-CoA ligase